MKKTCLLAIAAFCSLSSQSFAMPCDTAATRVSCASTTGKYSFETLTCGFDQNLRNSSLTIKSEPNAASEVRDQWFGKSFYAVEFDLSAKNGTLERFVSFEWNARTGKGMVTDKERDTNPAPWKAHSEGIHCKVMDVTGQG